MYTEELATAAQNGFAKLWRAMESNDAGAREAINGVQRGLKCCGNNGPLDWAALIMPPSCCEENAAVCTIANSRTDGCGKILFNTVNTSGMLIAWFAVVFGAFEVSRSKLQSNPRDLFKYLSLSQ